MPRLRHTVEQILAKLWKETRIKACGLSRSRCAVGVARDKQAVSVAIVLI